VIDDRRLLNHFLDVADIPNSLVVKVDPSYAMDPGEASFVRILADVFSLRHLNEAVLVLMRILLLVKKTSENRINVENGSVVSYGS